MPLPEINALSREILESDPRDSQGQRIILQRICELRDTLKRGGARDLVVCLDVAALLTESLATRGLVGSEDVTRVVAALMNIVNDSFIENEAREAATRRDEVRELHAPAPGTPLSLKEDGAEPLPPIPLLQSTVGAPTQADLPLIGDMVLGNVLVHLGHASEEDVRKALEIQCATGVRVGEALVKTGVVTWDAVDAGLQLQERLRHTYSSASPSAPSIRLGKTVSEEEEQSLFGELLVHLGSATQEEVAEALDLHPRLGIRVGEVLVKNGTLSQRQVDTALRIQRRLRLATGLPDPGEVPPRS